MHKWIIVGLLFCLAVITPAQANPPITPANAGKIVPAQVLSAGNFTGAAWSPDGNKLAFPTQTGVWIYDTELVSTPSYADHGRNNTVMNVTFAADGQSIFTHTFMGNIQQWNLIGQPIDSAFPADETTNTLSLTPTGDLLTVANNTVMVRSTADASTIGSFQLSVEGTVDAVTASPDNSVVAIANCELPSMGAGCEQSIITLQALADGSLIAEIPTPDNDTINDMVYSPDGTQIAVAGYQLAFNEATERLEFTNFVILWDNTTQTALTVDMGENIPRDLAYLPDGTLLVAAGEELQSYDPAGTLTSTYIHDDQIARFAVSPDGTQVVLAGAGAAVIDLTTEEVVARRGGHSGLIGSLAFIPGTNRLISSGWDGMARIWDIDSNQQVDSIKLDDDTTSGDLAIVDNGTAILIIVDRIITKWPLTTEGTFGEDIAGTLDTSTVIYGIEASVDGTLFVIGNGNGNVLAYSTDLTTPYFQTNTPSRGLVPDVAISPDNQRIAYVDREQLVVIGVDGTVLNTFPVQLTVQQTSFSTDGRWLASAGQELFLWDTNGGTEVHLSAPIDDSYSSVTFSPDGALVAAASGSGMMRVFDAASGDLLFEGRSQKNIRDLAFSEDGTTIATGAEDGTIILWRVG